MARYGSRRNSVRRRNTAMAQQVSREQDQRRYRAELERAQPLYDLVHSGEFEVTQAPFYVDGLTSFGVAARAQNGPLKDVQTIQLRNPLEVEVGDMLDVRIPLCDEILPPMGSRFERRQARAFPSYMSREARPEERAIEISRSGEVLWRSPNFVEYQKPE